MAGFVRLNLTTMSILVLTYGTYIVVSHLLQEKAFRIVEITEHEERARRNGSSHASSQARRVERERERIAHLMHHNVSIVLSRPTLQTRADFPCGGSQVVRFNGYASLRGIPHLDKVIPASDPFNSPTGKMFNTCAVIGNSGSLLEAQHGPEIDMHDAVIRFNAGITNGYEQFVGSKTTFRIYNKPQALPREEGETTISTLRDSDVRHWIARLRNDPDHANSALLLDPNFLCFSWQWVKNGGRKPSSGLVGMVMALKLCHSVTAYGFQFKNYFSRTSRPHYYDWERPAKGREGVHPFGREVNLYLLLEQFGYLHVVH